MSTEPCLVCEGSGKRPGPVACPYCAGTGRVTVRATGARTVLLATGSCKLPAKAVVLPAGLEVKRFNTPKGSPS